MKCRNTMCDNLKSCNLIGGISVAYPFLEKCKLRKKWNRVMSDWYKTNREWSKDAAVDFFMLFKERIRED